MTELKNWFSSGSNKVTEIVGVMVNLLEDRRKTLFTRGRKRQRRKFEKSTFF